jgi:ribose transport system permease protein
MKTRTSLLAVRELPAALVLAGSLIFLFLKLPSFRTPENLGLIGQQIGLIGIMACGEALVILTGGIDLSVGAIAGLAACVAGSRMHVGMGWAPATLLGLAAGAAAGLLNGAMITYRRLPPIITTLATLLIFRAGTNIVSGAAPYIDLPAPFKSLGLGFNPLLFFLLLIAILAAMLSRGRYGRNLIATGGSEQSARLSGIATDRVLRRAYLLAGTCAAVSGLLFAASSNSAQWNLAEGYELSAIAAVVIGGVKLTGGEGSIIGVGLGAAIMIVWQNGLFLLGTPKEWYGLVTGAVILIAAFAEQLRRAREAKAVPA